MNQILKDLNIDPKIIKHSKISKKKITFDKTKSIVPPFEDYNFQADHIHLPTTKKNYKYMLTVVDLATDECDFQPVQDQSSQTTLSAFKAIFKRPYLNKPYASIKTDSGNAFQGEVAKYLFKESILHSTSIAGRHKQTGNIEALNRQIGTILNAYMNSIEYKTGKTYREWTDILPELRIHLNNMRRKKLSDIPPHVPITEKIPMYKKGDLVYRKLDLPRDARGYNQATENFRVGDIRFEMIPRAIVNVLYYPNNIRYMLKGIPQVAYTEEELMEAEEEEEVAEVKEIVGDKIIKGKKHYLVHWYGELLKQATWEPEDRLIEDNLEDYIQFYKNKKNR